MRTVSPRNVAIIGAGAAGLVAARELRREGHQVVIFERQSHVGGTWVYNPITESDPLGIDPNRTVIHSSLYATLRTNLPREIMGFRDYPFVAVDEAHRDQRRFPGHREVLEYLNGFASEFGLDVLVRLGTEVRHVMLADDGKWEVKSRKGGGVGGIDGGEVEEAYDAVVVCCGHYSEPRIAEIPGIAVWPGKQIHSHNYRDIEAFRDQVVVLIGSSVSAIDISRDIVAVAKELHIATRAATFEAFGKSISFHPMIESVHEDGIVFFKNGKSVCADIILHCTGYRYHFPFLETNGIVMIDDNRVGPLYKHVFPPVLAPWLSFIGLPMKVIPFTIFEIQSKWIARVLSGRISIPSPDGMMTDVEAFYSYLEKSGIPKRYTHDMSGYEFEYVGWLAAECEYQPYEEWRKQMLLATLKNKLVRPETFRDEWDDGHLMLQAQEDFANYG